MCYQNDLRGETEAIRQFTEHPERFFPCANGWMIKCIWRHHHIQVSNDGLQCSCDAFKQNVLDNRPWCVHTRAAEILVQSSKLVRPISITPPIGCLPNDRTLFAAT